MQNRTVALILAGSLVVQALIGLAGCSLAKTTETPAFAVSVSGDSGFAQLAARAQMHYPGEEAIFDLTLQNSGTEPWQSRYCVELLDNERALATLDQGEVVVQPGEQLALEVRDRLPDDLPVGVYGLALVIPGRYLVIGSLPVGQAGQASTVSWPDAGCW